MQSGVPVEETNHLFVDDLLDPRDLLPAPYQVLVDHPLQAVHVLQEHVVDVAHFRVHVPRHADVDDEKRRIGALPHRIAHHVAGHDGQLGARRSDDDVGFSQRAGDAVECHWLAARLRGQVARAFERAIGDEQASDAMLTQAPGHQFARFACTDDQRRARREIRKHLVRQAHRSLCDADGAVRNLGFGSGAFTATDGCRQQTLAHDTRNESLLAGLEGVLDLLQNLGFAQHLRIDARPVATRNNCCTAERPSYW